MKKVTLVVVLCIALVLHWYMTNTQKMETKVILEKIQTTHVDKLHDHHKNIHIKQK